MNSNKQHINGIAKLISGNPRLNTTYPVMLREDADIVADLVNKSLPKNLQAVAIDFHECGFQGGVIVERKIEPKQLVFERGKNGGAKP